MATRSIAFEIAGKPDYRACIMIHENLGTSLENFAARMIALRDSL
jgi:hypothetical protein